MIYLLPQIDLNHFSSRQNCARTKTGVGFSPNSMVDVDVKKLTLN